MDSAPTVAGLDIWTRSLHGILGMFCRGAIHCVRNTQKRKQPVSTPEQNNGEQALVETLPIRLIVKPVRHWRSTCERAFGGS